jgi:hypothetical protein
MDFQLIIVLIVIVGALAFAGLTLARKAKGFSIKNDCGADCGCGDSKDKLTSSKV